MYNSFHLHNHPWEAGTVIIPRFAGAETGSRPPGVPPLAGGGAGIQPRQSGSKPGSEHHPVKF